MVVIDLIELGPYTLPLVQALALAGQDVAERRGLLVRLSCEGLSGVGDVAPLPGFSRESIEQAHRVLDALPIIGEDIDIEGLLEGQPVAALKGAPPSVCFGVECALLDLAAQRKPDTRNPMAPRAGEVHVNALLDEVTPEAVHTLAQQGYTCIKLKVGRQPLAADIAMVRSLVGVSDDVVVRLDANQAWSFSEACQFVNALEGLLLEYLEEPCQSPQDSLRLMREAGVPVGFDESLVGASDDQLLAMQGAAAFVIKPTLADGVSGAIRLARAARRCGAEPVISAAFESGVGIRALAHLANALMSPGVAAGLDTWRWLAQDVLDHDGPRTGPVMRLGGEAE